MFGLPGYTILYTRKSLIGKSSSLLAFFPLPQLSLNAFGECVYLEDYASAGRDKSCTNAGQDKGCANAGQGIR